MYWKEIKEPASEFPADVIVLSHGVVKNGTGRSNASDHEDRESHKSEKKDSIMIDVAALIRS